MPCPELSLSVGVSEFCHSVDLLATDDRGKNMPFSGQYRLCFLFKCGRPTYRHDSGEFSLYVDNRYGWVVFNKNDRHLPSFRGQTQPALDLCPAVKG